MTQTRPFRVDHSAGIATLLALLIGALLTFYPPILTPVAQAAPFEYENTTAIPNLDSFRCPTEISSTINVTDSFTIDDLNVGLNIDHTWRGDLEVQLQSPTGTSILLIQPDFPNLVDNFDMLLDDVSGNPVNDGNDDDTTLPFYDRTVAPDEALAAFNGEQAQGTWTLIICDRFGGDDGTLNRWALFFAGTPLPCPSGTALFVDANATGADNGTSWANALNDLQDALTLAASGSCAGVTEIWVANGTYYPAPAGSRDVAFELLNDIGVYGGFSGDSTNPDGGSDETLRTQRNDDPATNDTILSGDIDDDDLASPISDPTTEIAGNNSYHVVTSDGVSASAILDGFTITGGSANGSGRNRFGGGMLNLDSSPTLRNLIVAGNQVTNQGGGLFNRNSSPRLDRVLLRNNTSNGGGGGMQNAGTSSPTLTDVTFSNNQARNNGGGMFNGGTSSPTLINVTFAGNVAPNGGSGNGAAINHNSTGTLTIVDNTLQNNRGTAAIYNGQDGTLIIKGSTIENNPDGPGIERNNGSITAYANNITDNNGGVANTQATGGSGTGGNMR